MPIGSHCSLEDSFGRLPLTLEPPRIRTAWTPGGGSPRELAWRNWQNGYGYSRPGIVEDGYAYATTDDADYGPGADCREPGQVVPAGAITEVDASAIANQGVISDAVSINANHLYFLAGRRLIAIPNGNGAPSSAGDAGAGNVLLAATVAKYSGTAYAYLTMSTGFATFDGATLGTTTAFVRNAGIATVYWATADGLTGQRLVAGDTAYSVRHVALSSDPTSGANWSAQILAGEGVYNITRIISTGRHAYVATTGGLYDIDDLGQSVNLTRYHADSWSSLNGAACYYHDGFVLYSTETGIDAIDVRTPGKSQTEANWALPGASIGLPNETPIWGRATAFASDGGGVLASIFNGTDSYIIYGKRRDRLGIPGPGDWVWHGALAVFKNQKVDVLKVRPVDPTVSKERRLWIATQKADGTSTTSRLFYQSLPLGTAARQDLNQATKHRFGTAFRLYMTPRTGENPIRKQTVVEADVSSEQLSSTTTLGLSVLLDGTTTTALGTASGSPTQAVALALPDTSARKGVQVAPVVVGAGGTTAPPILTGVTLRTVTEESLTELWEMDVVIARGREIASGAMLEHARPELEYARLAEMQDSVRTFHDPWGNDLTALVRRGLPGELKQANQDSQGARGWVRTVKLVLEILDRPDGGSASQRTVYDADAFYDHPDAVYG